jgi:hypothetical protein
VVEEAARGRLETHRCCGWSVRRFRRSRNLRVVGGRRGRSRGDAGHGGGGSPSPSPAVAGSPLYGTAPGGGGREELLEEIGGSLWTTPDSGGWLSVASDPILV